MASTTRRQTTTRGDRRADIQQRLRAAIERLVADGSTFTELSVERLVAEAGISRSTFYVYFEDKGALLLALETASMRSFYDGARRWIDHGPSVTREDIRVGMREVLDAFAEAATIMRAVAETAVYDPAVRDHYNAGVQDYIRRLRRLIEHGRKTGEVRDVHPQATATALGWMLERTSQQAVPGASPKQLDELAEGLADIVWATLYAVE